MQQQLTEKVISHEKGLSGRKPDSWGQRWEENTLYTLLYKYTNVLPIHKLDLTTQERDCRDSG